MDAIFIKQDVHNKAVHTRMTTARSTERSAIGVNKYVLFEVCLLGPAWCKLFSVILLHFLLYMFRM